MHRTMWTLILAVGVVACGGSEVDESPVPSEAQLPPAGSAEEVGTDTAQVPPDGSEAKDVSAEQVCGTFYYGGCTGWWWGCSTAYDPYGNSHTECGANIYSWMEVCNTGQGFRIVASGYGLCMW